MRVYLIHDTEGLLGTYHLWPSKIVEDDKRTIVGEYEITSIEGSSVTELINLLIDSIKVRR